MSSSYPKTLPRTRLTYHIHKVSSVSAAYTPDKILDDSPADQASRWSSDSNIPPQYLILRLSAPAIVTHITFGKYEKTHVCNLKRFKVFGGVDEDNMVELLDSGLRNDPLPETFRLRHQMKEQFFPSSFIKVVPLLSWGPSFNYSIWHISLAGDASPQVVKPAIRWQNEYREREAIRLCLKHFRQQNFTDAFESLQKRTRISLEHPLLTELYDVLVKQGEYQKAEDMVENAMKDGLFDPWINSQQPSPQWSPLILPAEALNLCPVEDTSIPYAVSPAPSQVTPTHSSSASFSPENPLSPPGPLPEVRTPHRAPSPGQLRPSISHPSFLTFDVPDPPQAVNAIPCCRGGHQLVIDSATQTLYLFGGWDGHQDLGDFWSYDIANNKWRCISANAECEGGPAARSCHKLVLDPVHRHLFVLGRYVEKAMRDDSTMKSDFYMYDLREGIWTLITDDTAAMGGPHVIFDHQMCLDQETRTIYVFGGQNLFFSYNQPNADDSRVMTERRFSGLFEYHIPTNTWKDRSSICVETDVTSGGLVAGSSGSQDAAGAPQSTGVEGAMANSRCNIRSRASHSMLFHPGTRKLYIFGGVRKRDEVLNDFVTYSVDTGETEILCSLNGPPDLGDGVNSIMPQLGLTQRATIDVERNEIHVMTSLNKESREKSSSLEKHRDNRFFNAFWVYRINSGTWSCLYGNNNISPEYWARMQSKEPRPRYAHQLVYDSVGKVHFLFGGNPGGKSGREERVRLGDFWKLHMNRPRREEILRSCRVHIKTTQFLELSLNSENKFNALQFLRTELSSVVDHDNEKEEVEFQQLATRLFTVDDESPVVSSDLVLCAPSKSHVLRNQLFERLSIYFPDSMTPPRSSLKDLVPHAMEVC